MKTQSSTNPTRRLLSFERLSDAVAEAERLQSVGYQQAGRWDLSQILRHCSSLMAGSLDGFPIQTPKLVQWLGRTLILPGMLRRRGLKPNGRTLPFLVHPTGDAEEAIQEFRHLTRRLEEETGPMHPVPLCGPLSRDLWIEIHRIHTAHHLGFLIPLK